ncbi:CLUMA_CG004691, isoform A [Clunio marinus]|uniref:CLUMA_CG004691, isoform A n=1 Tax=Clunio marinus TaxID=568069 RepID=A0A1J1HSN8_9DIPT|nr:CLUMA_CG004691, isoform A [Clunio marinus]
MSECKRNIEIKAKLKDEKEFNEKIKIAQEITGQSSGEVIVQHDVFFKVPNGRLKLRYERDIAMLVQYSRDDVSGPKLSKFNVLNVSDGPLMEQMLDDSIGTLGVLDKTRHLFIHNGKTRIHLDVVKNNDSNYYGMEFEVVMNPEENLDVGNKIAEELMDKFQLSKSQLLEGSYFEILSKSSS